MGDAELLRRHRAVMPSWLTLFYEQPIEIVSGRGRRVTDSEGRGYLDFFGGILTNSIGYDIAEISDAVRRQVESGVFHTSTLYLIRSQVDLAEKIARLSGIPDAKVFFCNSGSEANDTALTLATNHRRSQQVLAIHLAAITEPTDRAEGPTTHELAGVSMPSHSSGRRTGSFRSRSSSAFAGEVRRNHHRWV